MVKLGVPRGEKKTLSYDQCIHVISQDTQDALAKNNVLELERKIHTDPSAYLGIVRKAWTFPTPT